MQRCQGPRDVWSEAGLSEPGEPRQAPRPLLPPGALAPPSPGWADPQSSLSCSYCLCRTLLGWDIEQWS